jgi:hypothetical protein
VCAVGLRVALGRTEVPDAGLALEYTMLAVTGLYPDSPGRESQDAHLVSMRFAGDPDLHLFAVFDGHGTSGAACAGFARETLPRRRHLGFVAILQLLAAATRPRRAEGGAERRGKGGRRRVGNK